MPLPEPSIGLSADTLAFGSVRVGEQTNLPLTIYNLGDATLVLYEVSTTNQAFSSDFDPADSLIAAGDSLLLTVTFAPVEGISYNDTLSIQSNDDPVAVMLLGTGTVPTPQIALSNDSLNFGEVVVGSGSNLPLMIHNLGDTTLVIYGISAAEPSFSTNFDPADSLIAPGDSLLVMVTFAPEAIDLYDDSLVIENNDEPKYVALYGDGVGPVAITLTPLSPPIVIPPGGGSFDFNIAVENLTTGAQSFDLWTVIRLPEVGEVPVLTVSGLSLPAGVSADRDRTQQVPGIAPPGVYTYYGYVGDYPWVIEDYNTFTFEKVGGDLNASLGSPADWICTGEGFEDLMAGAAGRLIPDEYSLSQNYPNPFNPLTTIRLGLPESGYVKLTVYDMMGRQIIALVNGYREAGIHEVTFDATSLASGLYVYRIEAGRFATVRKMVLVK